MPKDKNKLIQELQKQRELQIAQSSKYVPSKIDLQIIGSGAYGEPRAIIIATDHRNYLFNCGEGIQRLANEHRVRLTKIENVFITRPVWDNMGGLLGLALTVQDSGTSVINLHGPDGTKDMFEATKKFVILETLKVVEADTSKKFVDNTMGIDFISIINPKEFKTVGDEKNNKTFDGTNSSCQADDYGKRLKSSDPINTINSSSKSRINSIMAFVCKIHPKPGTLDTAKCAQYGVPAGPYFGQLKAGHDITLPDGKVVKSSDVVSQSEDGPTIIVLECPDEDWLEIIENSNEFDNYQKPETEEKSDNYIVHFTPKNILNNIRYQKWMEKFGTNTQHLIVNEENIGFSSEAIHIMQHKLHLIHPEIFPLLEEENLIVNDFITKEQKSNCKLVNNCLNSLPNVYQCKTLNSVNLRSRNGFDGNLKVSISPEEYKKDAGEIEGFLDCLAELKTNLNEKSKSLIGMQEYPKLLMLGTGSSIPNKTRNTSGMLFQITEDKSIILDCGEGTIGQLIRFFGIFKVEKILKSIKAVYISHLHADHHMGFIGILKERAKFTKERLYLLAPHHISEWLEYYNNRFEEISDCYTLLSNEFFKDSDNVSSEDIATIETLYEKLNILNINTTHVHHCSFAYGVSIELKDKRKIVYSGDICGDGEFLSENLINLGKKCYLLIHEATMEDGLEEEAKIKKHSTISQAIKAGKQMEATFTLLTHFSQRYSKLPFLPNENSDINLDSVGIAYDFMHVSLSQLTLLPLFYPSLKVLFHEFKESLYQKAKLRDMKKERELKDNKVP